MRALLSVQQLLGSSSIVWSQDAVLPVCPYIMFVRAVLQQVPYRIGSRVSSTQSYPSPPADRGIIPMGTVWLISIFASQVLALVNAAAAALDINAVQRTSWIGKRKVANTIKSDHWSGKHTVISLQKSYNGCKHNKRVALLLREFAVYVEQKQTRLHTDTQSFFFFLFFFWHVMLERARFILLFVFNNTKRLRR